MRAYIYAYICAFLPLLFSLLWLPCFSVGPRAASSKNCRLRPRALIRFGSCAKPWANSFPMRSLAKTSGALGNGSLLRWSLSGRFFLKCSAQRVPVATPCVKHRLGGRWDGGGRSRRTPVPIVRHEPASVKRRWKLFIARPCSDWNAMCPPLAYGKDAELKSSMAPVARCPIRQKIRRPTHSQGVKSQGGAFLPGQRRTLGGRARNFTGPRKPALSTTLASPQSARYPLSRPGILLLLFHPLSPSARRRFSHAFASTAPRRFSTRQTAG